MYLFLGGDHINKNTKKTILAMLSISLISSYIIIEKGVFALNLGIFTKLIYCASSKFFPNKVN